MLAKSACSAALLLLACAQSSFADLWAVGDGGTIIHTAGPGSPWIQQSSGTTNALTSICFTDPVNGWAVGSSIVLHTTDGGATWTAPAVAISSNWRQVSFSDPLHGWVAAGAPNLVYKTIDGGVTWANVPVPVTPPAVFASVTGLSFDTADHGWLQDLGGLYETKDAGAHWSLRSTGSLLSSLDLIDATHIWSGNTSPGPNVSTDGGLTWQTLSASGTLYRNSFADPLHGWLVGAASSIDMTTDGGTTWTFRSTGAVFGLTDLLMADAGHGWAFDNHGDIRYSADGGVTWSGITSPISGSIRGTFISAPEPATGMLSLAAAMKLLLRRHRKTPENRQRCTGI